MSLEEMVAWSPTMRVPLSMGVVVRGLPFHWTTDAVLNMLPLSVRVKLDPPAVALLGLSEVITGDGALTVKGNAFELCPLLLVTWTLQFTPSVPKVGLRLICSPLMN